MTRPLHLDASGLEILEREDCLALISSTTIGRIVFTASALPAVLPITFAFDGESIVFKTGAQTRLAAAGTGGVVAFEVDEVDQVTLTGWSVVVTGRLTTIRDPEELAKAETLPLRSWVPAPRDRFLRITPEIVSGRRIRRAPAPGVPAPQELRTVTG